MSKRNKIELGLIVAITFFAFGLRLWQLEATPPGWRDDEIINSLVISQHVLDGDLAVYYADASGHEPGVTTAPPDGGPADRAGRRRPAGTPGRSRG